MINVRRIVAGIVLILAGSLALAEVNVGVTLSASGPASALGIPEKNTFALVPTNIQGTTVNYIVFDDASDTGVGVENTRRLIRDYNVDVIVGSTITPTSLAMIDVVAQAETPMISLAASTRIVDPVDGKRRWVFKTPQNDAQMAVAITEHMSKAGATTAAFIGFSDAYGESWWNQFRRLAEVRKIRIVASERYKWTDKSVVGQVLKILAADPDVILVAGSGAPAVLPQVALKERGYRGTVYQTHGAASGDFLRLGGQFVEGTVLPAGPVLVAGQLEDGNPIKQVAMDYVARYEAVYGKGSVSAFGAHAWDASILLQHAVPIALASGRPGTKAFRGALRDALEGLRNVVGVHGVFNMSPRDHLGFDQRARVMVRVENGAWKLVP